MCCPDHTAPTCTCEVELLASISSSRPCLTVPSVVQAPERAAGKGFKAAREAERKASSGNRAAWSTLFMRPDTVAAAVAEHYGVSRAELLDREAAGLIPLAPPHTVSATQGSSCLLSASVTPSSGPMGRERWRLPATALNENVCVL